VRAPLPYESITFLAPMCLPLPTGLSDFAALSSAYLTLVAWMSSWVFILCISFFHRAEHCLSVGFLFFNLPMSPFIPYLWAGWCSYHVTTFFLLWYHLHLFTLLLFLGLRVEVLAMLVSYIIPSFCLYCPAFLLGQFIQHLGLPRPILFLRHPRPVSFFRHP